MRLWGTQLATSRRFAFFLPRCTCACVHAAHTRMCTASAQEDLKALVVSNKGFEWVDDASPVPGVPQSPKLGWAATPRLHRATRPGGGPGATGPDGGGLGAPISLAPACLLSPAGARRDGSVSGPARGPAPRGRPGRAPPHRHEAHLGYEMAGGGRAGGRARGLCEGGKLLFFLSGKERKKIARSEGRTPFP